MIKELKITNFKCFKNPGSIKFKNFNVICGPNSSGKSSINQSLLLLLQNNHKAKQRFTSSGKFVHFDEYNELRNFEKSQSDSVEIIAKNEEDKTCSIKLGNSSQSGNIECLDIKSEYNLIEEEDLYFISANRIGPEDVYNKYNENLINQFGENAIGFLAKNKDMIIDEKFIFQKDPEIKYSLGNEVDYWLNKIIGEKINTTEIIRTNKSIATYSRKMPVLDTLGLETPDLQVRNMNTGSGLSYIITILVMVLSLTIKETTKRPLFIIENPEIHLHPMAQINLMKFLLHMSQFGQFIIETHSDHIIKNILDSGEDVQIIKLKDDPDKIEYYYFGTRHILPTLTLSEIQWSAFDLPTIDFHVHLFSFLQERFAPRQGDVLSVNETDDKIRLTQEFINNEIKYETNSPRYNSANGTETLPTYMRNLIDHPESSRNLYRNDDEFDEKLRESIDFMIKIIKEKGWR